MLFSTLYTEGIAPSDERDSDTPSWFHGECCYSHLGQHVWQSSLMSTQLGTQSTYTPYLSLLTCPPVMSCSGPTHQESNDYQHLLSLFLLEICNTGESKCMHSCWATIQLNELFLHFCSVIPTKLSITQSRTQYTHKTHTHVHMSGSRAINSRSSYFRFHPKHTQTTILGYAFEQCIENFVQGITTTAC